MRALVAGGGIGGLAVARLLARGGADVVVVEQAPSWQPVGAGITLAANALAVLDHLGIGAAVRAVGRTSGAATVADERGRPLARARLGAVSPRGPELLAVHRAALHACLVDGLDVGLGVEVRLGTTVHGLVVTEHGVRAQLSDGSAPEVDVVVGADGLRSSVRTLLLGAAAPPVRYAGYTCWRAVAPEHADPEHADVDEPVEQWGRGQRVGVVPLADDTTYAFLTEDAPPGGQGGGTPEELRARFAGFGGAAGRLLDALDLRARILRHDIEELGGIVFGAGRIALLGDAAHAMTPNLGQGAGQALEDAVVLSRELSHAELSHAEVGDAVASYARRRRRRVAALHRRSRVVGRLGQMSHPAAVGLRNALLRAVPERVLLRQAERLVAPGSRLVSGS